MTTQEKHEHKWRAYGQLDGTVVCDECDGGADVNDLINQARKEGAIEELEKSTQAFENNKFKERIVSVFEMYLQDRIKSLKEGK